MSNPITIANIVMEMRGLVKPGETLNHTYELLNGLADRIEAAQKMEVGNGAKIYEALKQILALAKAKGLFEIQSIAETALAEPPRNCDVIPANKLVDEFVNRFMESCEGVDDKGAVAQYRKLFMQIHIQDFLQWITAPYESEMKK